jgi:hypothetical protein
MIVVTVTHSDVLEGTRVCWFGSYHEERDGRPFIEVSHHGIYVSGYYDRFPEGAIDAALEAFRTVQRKHNANLDHLATHHRVKGDLLPIERAGVQHDQPAEGVVGGGE